ncbi:MAG: hypothetical protein QM522_04440 [Chitinophagaceae bacterium]|nr:hypothetical protein [Chitinophagaceae bacterium]
MKLLSKAALAAVLAAPVAFSSPSFAQSACVPGSIADYVNLGSTGCISGDKIYSDFSFTNFAGSTGLSITNAGPQHTFSASGLNFGVGTTASYSYTVAIAPGNPNASFLGYRTAATSSDIFNPIWQGTKTLTGTPNGGVSTSTNGTTGNTILYSPTIGGPVTFTGGINVTSGRMDVLTDTLVQQIQVPVPGPLPILGAAAAFGYSRRLRKRISTSHQR